MLARKISTVDKNFPIFAIVSSCACLKINYLNGHVPMMSKGNWDDFQKKIFYKQGYSKIHYIKKSIFKHSFPKSFHLSRVITVRTKETFTLERLK